MHFQMIAIGKNSCALPCRYLEVSLTIQFCWLVAKKELG